MVDKNNPGLQPKWGAGGGGGAQPVYGRGGLFIDMNHGHIRIIFMYKFSLCKFSLMENESKVK